MFKFVFFCIHTLNFFQPMFHICIVNTGERICVLIGKPCRNYYFYLRIQNDLLWGVGLKQRHLLSGETMQYFKGSIFKPSCLA